jgi:hypothetical protein
MSAGRLKPPLRCQNRRGPHEYQKLHDLQIRGKNASPLEWFVGHMQATNAQQLPDRARWLAPAWRGGLVLELGGGHARSRACAARAKLQAWCNCLRSRTKAPMVAAVKFSMKFGSPALVRYDCPKCKEKNSLFKHNACIHCGFDRTNHATSFVTLTPRQHAHLRLLDHSKRYRRVMQ